MPINSCEPRRPTRGRRVSGDDQTQRSTPGWVGRGHKFSHQRGNLQVFRWQLFTPYALNLQPHFSSGMGAAVSQGGRDERRVVYPLRLR